MPYEDKNNSNEWKIEFVKCGVAPKADMAEVQFIVSPPDGKEKMIKIIYGINFISDYFKIASVSNRENIVQEKCNTLKLFSLVKIEELINKNLKEKDIRISSCKENFEWAEKIENGIITPSSSSQDNKTYTYIPQRKIGF